MKVVLFCGGFGTRMRTGVPGEVPKPMALVGPRPLLWHVMRYYAHFGHKEFILCLGYGAHHIKDFFLGYQEATSNDFVLRGGKVELLSSDISDWSISFVQTGPTPRSVNGCAASVPTWAATRYSSRTTRTCSPTHRCPTSSTASSNRARPPR